MSVFPLNIPEKINTPELLAFFQQFGLDKYLSAEEINKMTAGLAELKEASTNVAIINTIFVNNSFTKVGQIFKGNAGTQWNINGLNYTNPTDQEITIPLCATGKVRTDRIVLDTTNNFVRVQGVEFTANPVAQSKPVNTIDYTFIPVNDSEVGEPDTPTVGNIFNKKDYDKVYTFNASGANVEIPFNVSGFSTIELTGSLTSVKGFSFTDLDANPTLAEWPHKGKPIYLINRSGHNIELKHNNLTAILPFNFDSGSSIIFPNNGKILLKVMTNNVIDFFKSWGDTSEKLDKVSTVDVEKVYLKNADGTQGMKPVSEIGVSKRTHFIEFSFAGGNFSNASGYWFYVNSYGGKYNQPYGPLSTLTPSDNFAAFYNAFSERVPFDCKVKNVYVHAFNNGLTYNLELAILNFKLASTFGSFAGSGVTDRVIIARETNSISGGGGINKAMSDSNVDNDYILKKGSCNKLFINTGGSTNAPIQNPLIIIEVEEV
ncbi:hypothetical protein [Flavobacterium facile]|uniref:hypothetical protein n=1 Tax=Flavobacterium facile TaxID=2893174 RepID=UPI002E776252|nr:hypothetical protein [Flavobacterium sp. T-12]